MEITKFLFNFNQFDCYHTHVLIVFVLVGCRLHTYSFVLCMHRLVCSDDDIEIEFCIWWCDDDTRSRDTLVENLPRWFVLDCFFKVYFHLLFLFFSWRMLTRPADPLRVMISLSTDILVHTHPCVSSTIDMCIPVFGIVSCCLFIRDVDAALFASPLPLWSRWWRSGNLLFISTT